MYRTIRTYGIIPFFANPVPGFSIEEQTPRECWFDSDILGPWDWKIYCLQSGDIAYGKFLWGGKSAFATLPWYRELMNWRRSLPKYAPTADQQKIMDFVRENGETGIREVRNLLGIKKGAADALVSKLQMQTRLVTGDIRRVYRGEDLHYNGWQVSSFCTPEDLFDLSFTDCSPEESRQKIQDHITSLFPGISDKLMQRMLG